MASIFYTKLQTSLFYCQAKAHVNGLPPSPHHQQTQTSLPSQQTKPSQAANGIRLNPNFPSQSVGNVKMSVSNGRRQAHSDQLTDKQNDHDTANMGYQIPVFAKPFKVPSNQDQSQTKTRPSSNHAAATSQNDGGRDVESILKMMTSTLEPLTKIAATPRTEVEVQQPNKPYVYAIIPPFLRPPVNCSKCEYSIKVKDGQTRC